MYFDVVVHEREFSFSDFAKNIFFSTQPFDIVSRKPITAKCYKRRSLIWESFQSGRYIKIVLYRGVCVSLNVSFIASILEYAQLRF